MFSQRSMHKLSASQVSGHGKGAQLTSHGMFRL
jgi:hypothetical protein